MAWNFNTTMKMSNYGLEIVSYRAPFLWVKFPPEYKYLKSLNELEIRTKI